MAAKFVIGVDLGTTNSVAAYAPLDADEPTLELLEIPQLAAGGTIETRTTLPSFLYLAPAVEAEQGQLDLPWAAGRNFAVGELARRSAAESPDRTVSAAKSWLCHARVDRRQGILPWTAAEDVVKISPVEASRRVLEHLRMVWDAAHPDALMADQQVVLTVPASFDPSARELTREAAVAAGLPGDLLLLEEPQAALYAWLGNQPKRWRKQLKLDDVLLVCDVGGGTSDFTLVRAAETDGELELRRMAVGNHLLVGGDNMDLTLAHWAAQKFQEQGASLDPWQSVSLWHACRDAKERLLTSGGVKKHALTVKGRGSKLIGKALSLEVNREELAAMLVDGFFPKCELTDRPQRRRASGFQEIGLPFEHDTGVTRHLAAFLQAQGDGDRPAQPTHILFNGGVFKAKALQARLLEVLAHWFPKSPAKLLAGQPDLDHAVARGAAFYGWTKHHGGVRIRGGTARSYYVGIETAGLAIPGAPRPLRALCVVPMGMEEGTEADVPSQEIGLVVGEPAQFRFFSSPVRKHDRPGDLLASWTDEELSETSPLEASLPADPALEDPFVPVKFRSRVTELGMFELWCVSPAGAGEWKLEFSVRDDE